MENWYFLISDGVENLQDIRNACMMRHIEMSPATGYSEAYGVFEDGNPCRLIKVPGGDAEWQAGQPWVQQLLVPPLLQGREADDEYRTWWSKAQVDGFDAPDDADESPDTLEEKQGFLTRLRQNLFRALGLTE